MTDLALGGTWLVVLAAAFGVALVIRALGIASTYVRDMLHIGAGIWVIGWPWWHGTAVPIAIVGAVALGVAFVPTLARRSHFVERLQRCVTSDDEHWGGLVLYTIAYAIFTVIGVMLDPFAAGAALLALSLGDGIGGAVGRALGDHHYRAPGGKQKSFEGSLVVLLCAVIGALLASLLFATPLPLASAFVLGAVAAVTEAFSPRGTDNLLIPAAVYIAAHLVT